MAEHATVELLKGFLEAFNRHDLDSTVSHFADDCVFYMPRGARPRGDRYVGKDEVRPAWRNASRGFRTCITETISTGCAAISESRSGH